MTIEHDAGKTGDLIVNIADARAHELGQGTTIRLLRYSEETGDWVLWVEMQPGATFAGRIVGTKRSPVRIMRWLARHAPVPIAGRRR